MSLNFKYAIAFKTGDAELKAIENSDLSPLIFPIVEITRGRKTKKDKIGSIAKRLDSLYTIFHQKDICLDITSTDALINEEINELLDPNDGYKKWCNFLKTQKEVGVFNKIYPTLVMDINDSNFKVNIEKEVQFLFRTFNAIVYRHNIDDYGFEDDIKLITNQQSKYPNSELIFIFDCSYINLAGWRPYFENIKEQIESLLKINANLKIVILSTSFPNNVSDIGKDDTDSFPLAEIILFEETKKTFSTINIVYGDYASINPIRNDDIVMANGWVPRIDVPRFEDVFYYRQRRNSFRIGNNLEKESYASTYTDVARIVIEDSRFPKTLDNNWGIQQIKKAADGYAPGARPSFWIAVRMNIHIAQQARRLGIS